MSINDRLGLLLDLSTLDPPPFKSEVFARWCCQATIALLACDSKALDASPFLAPGTFLAFTQVIPGMDDLPRLDHAFLEQPPQLVARGRPKFVTNDGEEVNVLVVVYEMVRATHLFQCNGILCSQTGRCHLVGSYQPHPHCRKGAEAGRARCFYVQAACDHPSSGHIAEL